jgi:PIN domain nuclease of toxin-antitoxin system
VAVSLLADTQVLVWYLREPQRLTATAKSALQAATDAGDLIGVAAFSIVELVYASEKPSNPITADDVSVIVGALEDPASPFAVLPLDAAIAAHVGAVPRADNADPGDRIIVAAAEVLGVPLVSADRKIPSMTSIDVIW